MATSTVQSPALATQNVANDVDPSSLLNPSTSSDTTSSANTGQFIPPTTGQGPSGVVQPPDPNNLGTYDKSVGLATGNTPTATPPSTTTGGLITGATLPNTTPGSTPGTSSSAGTTPTSYTPTTSTVSDKETVAGQVNDLLKQDNPIMQTARTQAGQAANARGLLNSSMAVQSGEQAAINSALPIAQSDAATYHDTAMQNMAAQNTAGQFNSNAANQLQLQGLRGDQATQVANIEATYKTLMQTSASAAQLYTQTVQTIGALLDDPNTTADQKQQAIDKQIQLLQNGLSAFGATGNVDLTSLLDFSQVNQPVVPPPAPTPAPSPAPSGTAGAGHNVGDTYTDAFGRTLKVNPDGSVSVISEPTYNG